MGSLSHEMDVKAPAAQAWSIYGTLQLPEFVRQHLPDLFQGIHLIEGDGGAGTKLHLIYPPNPLNISHSKEEYVVVDNATLTKVTEIYQGGYLDIGFSLYRVTIQVLPHPADASSCTVKCVLEYQLRDDAPQNAASLITIQPLVDVMNAISGHLLKSHAPN